MKKVGKYRNNCSRYMIFTISLVALLGIFILGTHTLGKGSSPKEEVGDSQMDGESVQMMEVGSKDVADIRPSINVRDINSPDVFLIDATTGDVISENHGSQKIYPASMTKIMTAVLAIENSPYLEETMEIPAEMFHQLYAENASRAGFEPGELATIEDLIYGVMLPSGAECCLTLAEKVAGSETEFVELMNERAKELGMKNTNFCNSTGLHDEQHYTTTEDLAVLLRFALQSSMFRDVFTSSQYTTSSSSIHPQGFTFNSTLFKYLDDPKVTGGELLGGKTGYTQEAGQCLASLANVGGKDYILITAGAPGDQMIEQLHIDDAITIFNRLGQELER